MHALFLPLVASSAIVSWWRPAPRQHHSTGILTVRRPRETIPVNFRVVVNFDIAIDAAKSSGGRIGRVSGVSRTGGGFFLRFIRIANAATRGQSLVSFI